MDRAPMAQSPRKAKTPLRVEAPRMSDLQMHDPRLSDPRPDNTPAPDEVDPVEGTEPDGTPVENPSGRLAASARAALALAA